VKILAQLSLKSKTYFSFALKILSVGLNIGGAILAARLLGVAEFGVYAIVLAWVNILGTAATLGLNQVTLRELSVIRSINSEDFGNSLRRFARKSTLIVGLILGLVLAFGFKLAGDSSLQSLGFLAISAAALAVVFRAQIYMLQAEMRALGFVLAGQLPELLYRPIVFFMGVFLLGFINTKPTSSMLLGVFALALMAAYWGGAVHTYRTIPRPKFKVPASSNLEKKKWLQTGAVFWVVNVFTVLLREIDIILLGILVGPAEAGIFAVVRRAINVLMFGGTVVNMVYAPLFAAKGSEKSRESLQDSFGQATNQAFILVVPIAVCFLIWGDTILGFFGSEFKSGYYALIIFGLGELFQYLLGPAVLALHMTNHEQVSAKIVIWITMLKVPISALLISQFGLMGAGVAAGLSLAMHYSAASYAIYALERIKPVFLSPSRLNF